MPRHLLIISRETPYLVDYMREQFRDEPSVEVFLDRRRRDANGAAAPAPDRRERRDVEQALRDSFHVFITVA
jgi:hypothetical protein